MYEVILHDPKPGQRPELGRYHFHACPRDNETVLLNEEEYVVAHIEHVPVAISGQGHHEAAIRIYVREAGLRQS